MGARPLALAVGLFVLGAACSADPTKDETPPLANEPELPDASTADAAPPLEPSLDAGADSAPAGPTVLRGVNMFTFLYMSSWSDLLEPQSAFDFLGKQHGHRIMRLPFAWAPLQPALGGPLDAKYLGKLQDQIAKAASAGMQTILDLHDYTTDYGGRPASAVGTMFQVGEFADVWRRLSDEFKNDARVIAYDLQNEPNNVSAATWQASSKAAAKAIRDNGDAKLLWVESINWSAVQDFDQVTPWMDDANVMYSAHEYFEYSGSYQKGFDYDSYATETASALSRLKVFTDWCATNKVRCSIGEVGWPSSRRSSSWQKWNALAESWFSAADAAKLWVTYWCGTSVFDEVQVAYDAPANSQTLPGISVAETQSQIIEKHGSF